MGDISSDFSPPDKQTVLTLNENQDVIIWTDSPMPPLGPDQVMGSFATPWAVLGADFCGTVVAMGKNVGASGRVQLGDRVCGAQNSMCANTPEQGAFGEYNVSRGGLWLKVPDSMTTEEAASLPAGICTAALAIRLLGLPLPNPDGSPAVDKPQMVLIYGGSTATACVAMQLLKLAGLIPIATCSPRNFELARKNGAEQVFDYREHDCAQKIRSYTKNNLKYALDCITNVESTTFCFLALGRAGGRYVSLDPFPEHAATRKMVTTGWVLGPTIFGEGSTWPAPYFCEPSEEYLRFGVGLWDLVQRLVDEGKLHCCPLRVLEGGLGAVMNEALPLVGSGKLSGEKIVVRMS
ncbi:enoyl reductase [Acephala macrosclerotiorum]|nr:enoyl reductase [Acephala macrosclerotiorum]